MCIRDRITNIENTDGSNISFSMSGFTSDGASRYCKIMGTKGDITADMTKNIIEIGLFGQPREVIDVTKLATDFSGHGGGDVRMVLEFLEMITTGKEPQGITSLEQSINSHLVAFAAEESRLNPFSYTHLRPPFQMERNCRRAAGYEACSDR